jgi:hypothetical protein
MHSSIIRNPSSARVSCWVLYVNLDEYFKHKIIYEEFNTESEELCVTDLSSLHLAISDLYSSQM